MSAVANPNPHRYAIRCSWSGSTKGGYHDYDRNLAAQAPPGPPITLSADPTFGGDPTRLNPEQLVVLAASSCQLLSFLAVAARARLDVTGYEDDAEGEMPTDRRPIHLTRIVLRPHITVAPPVDEDQVRRLVEVAHRECFIANSLRSEIVVEPTIVPVS